MWLFALQHPDGSLLSPLSRAYGQRLSFRRRGWPEAAFNLGLDDPDAASLAAALLNGIPILRAWRKERQADGHVAAVPHFAGFIPPEAVSEADDDDRTEMGIAASPAAKLERRFTAELKGFAGETDAGLVAWELISDANDGVPEWDEPGSDTGISKGTIKASYTVDPVYERREIPAAILELADATPGFDPELSPVDEGSTVAKFNVHGRRGEDRDLNFAYGEGTLGNVISINRTREPLRNRVRVFGDEGVIREAIDQASIDRYGLHDHHESMSEVIDWPLLQARADELLTPYPVQIVGFSPDPTRAPVPLLDYDVGDTVSLYARLADGYEIDARMRIEEITISLDDNGDESEHSISVKPA